MKMFTECLYSPCQIPQLVHSTTAMYNTITTELLPTPAKSHYTFNLRDLSKVFQGMLMVPINKIKVCLSVCICSVEEQNQLFSQQDQGLYLSLYPF